MLTPGKDQTVVLVATGQTRSAAIPSVEIFTRNEFGNYTSRQVESGGKCSVASNYPKKTTLGVGAVFNGLPSICEGYTMEDQGGDCFQFQTDGSWTKKFELTRPLTFGGSSVAFENLTDLNRPWFIVGGDNTGKLPEVWGGQPPSEIVDREFLLPYIFKSNPCIARISDDEAFVTAIPRGEDTETNFAWIFNMKTNTWQRIDNTLQKRSGSACGFIQTNSGRFVVLTGGSDTTSTEILNLDTLAWSNGPNLPFNGQVQGASMVSASQELLLIGGNTKTDVLGNILRMNSSMSSWDNVGQLQNPRFYAVAMAVRAGDLPPLCD